jgi:hypothetical protein
MPKTKGKSGAAPSWATKTREWAGPEDRAWLGDESTLDSEALLKTAHHDPELALDLILLAIIDAHPKENQPQSRLERLDRARAALTGVERKRGNDDKDDYDLLLAIAWDYFVAWAPGQKSPALAPIIRRRVERLPQKDPRRGISAEADVHRLRRKFNASRDLLLARVSSDDDHDRMDRIRAFNHLIELLHQGGVPVTLGSAKPHRRKTESKRAQ